MLQAHPEALIIIPLTAPQHTHKEHQVAQEMFISMDNHTIIRDPSPWSVFIKIATKHIDIIHAIMPMNAPIC